MTEVNHNEIPARKVFTPSNWKRSMQCVGWGRLAKKLKVNGRDNGSNEIADRGTRIHDYAKKILKGEYIKESDPEEWAEAKKFVEFVETVRRQFSARHTDVAECVEEQFEIVDGIKGTIDYGIWGKNDTGTWDIAVVDLKTGFIEVDALENPQVLGYLAGLEKHLMGLGYEIGSYHGFIFQDEVWSKHRYTSDEFDKAYSFAVAEVRKAMAVYNDTGPDYELTTGIAGCRYCPCLKLCPKHKHDIDVVSISQEINVVRSLSDAERVEVYLKTESIKKFLSVNEEALLNELKGGKQFDDIKLIRGSGSRIWIDEKKTIEAITAVGKSPFVAPKLVGVMLGDKYLTKEQMKELTVVKEGSLKIALVSDKAPAVEIGFDAVPEDNTFDAA